MQPTYGKLSQGSSSIFNPGHFCMANRFKKKNKIGSISSHAEPVFSNSIKTPEFTFFLKKKLLLSNIRHLTVHWHKRNKYGGAKLNAGACYDIYRSYYRLHFKNYFGRSRKIAVCGQIRKRQFAGSLIS